MTETLHRPTSPDAEQLAHYDKQLAIVRGLRAQEESPADVIEASPANIEADVTETHDDVRTVSPFAVRVRNAAERFATILEQRAIGRAHDAALKEYRDRDHSGYVDHVAGLASDGETDDIRSFNKGLLRKDERRTDREELIEGATLQLRALGGLALDKTKDAGLIALGVGAIGYEKAEKVGKDAGLIALGVGVMGYEAASKRVDTAKFRHELNATERNTRKSDKKELRQHDKHAKRELKREYKQIKKDTKQLTQEDRAFDRDLARTARVEKWEARVDKVEGAIRSKKEAVIGRTSEAYRTSKESYEAKKLAVANKKRRLGAFAVKARTAGAAALSAGREELKK